MSRRVNTPGRHERRRRGPIWVFISVAFVAALLYWEQAALLYVLSTLAVCGLLLVVAFSDLEGGEKGARDSTRNEEAVPHPERRAAKLKRQDAA